MTYFEFKVFDLSLFKKLYWNWNEKLCSYRQHSCLKEGPCFGNNLRIHQVSNYFQKRTWNRRLNVFWPEECNRLCWSSIFQIQEWIHLNLVIWKHIVLKLLFSSYLMEANFYYLRKHYHRSSHRYYQLISNRNSLDQSFLGFLWFLLLQSYTLFVNQ